MISFYALQKLGLSGKDCIVVEDSVIGLQVHFDLLVNCYFRCLRLWNFTSMVETLKKRGVFFFFFIIISL